MLAAIGPSFIGYGPFTMPCQTKHPSHARFLPVCEFPSFLPKEVDNIKDPFARKLASRIERVPVQVRAELYEILPFISVESMHKI